MEFDPYDLDPRFAPASYCFVLGALNAAIAKRVDRGHVSGVDICVAFRELALQTFGLMARTVIEHWGFHSTADIGRAIYILADAGVLFTREGDSIDEFRDVFDFGEFDAYHQTRGFALPDDAGPTTYPSFH